MTYSLKNIFGFLKKNTHRVIFDSDVLELSQKHATILYVLTFRVMIWPNILVIN